YHDPETMETNVRGLFVAGTAAGGTQYKFEFFISTTHHHVTNIVRAIAHADAGPVGTTERRYHEATWEEVKAN
ncbi:MAG: pyridine nucleotide-disulfide oxidoreductase, partial [Anaerolineae bacterium]|nr:pyridine nucleotide-disulfide oxidoreductase [Anaerolineae bacterium]